MKTPTRKAGMFGTVLILAAVFIVTVGLPEHADAQGQSGVIWNIHSESEDSQATTDSGNSEDHSERTEQHSNDGQDMTDETTRHVNEDGSSHESEEYHYSDGFTGTFRRNEDTDSKGNRKVHSEEIFEKDGKCEIVIIDEEYDSSNKLTKHTEKRTPCSKFSLQVSWEGSWTPEGWTQIFGPDIALIPLGFKNGTYDGGYEGIFHSTGASTIGNCTSTSTYQVSFTVTAKEDEFKDLDFSVKFSVISSNVNVCPRLSNKTTALGKKTFSFTLPAEDGAAYNDGWGGATLIFTLKMLKP